MDEYVTNTMVKNGDCFFLLCSLSFTPPSEETSLFLWAVLSLTPRTMEVGGTSSLLRALLSLTPRTMEREGRSCQHYQVCKVGGVVSHGALGICIIDG